MRQPTAITQFIMEIAYLLDKGVKYSLEEVNRHIENKDVIEWLEQNHPFGSKTGLDFSLFDPADRKYIHDGLDSYFGGYAGDERRKWGITDNGLCILICWATEMTRDLLGRS